MPQPEPTAPKQKPPVRWTVRSYRPGDEAGILDLARLVFTEQPADRFSLDYWRWEYVANSSGAARIMLADDGDRIAGHYAVVPRSMQVGDQVRMGSVIVDLMTHPDYRQQGMFVAMARQALPEAGQAGLEFSIGFVVRKAVMPGARKLDWRHLLDIPVLARPLRFDRVVRAYLNVPGLSDLVGLAARIGYEFGVRPVMAAFPPRPPAQPASLTIQAVDAVDARFDVLWSRANRQFPVMGVRDAAYLEWRYCQHPYHKYQIWVAQAGQQLLGYIVTRTGDLLGLRAGIIVDILADADHLWVIDGLVQRVVREFQQSPELDLIACMMTRGGPYFAALQRQGLIVTPKVFWFVLHLNDARAPAPILLAPGNWYLTWGDTDVI